jgi:hypothetical protein
MRVLLVEDDLNVAESVIRALELRGHDVKHATTVAQGEDLINDYHFELGIIDLNLPDGLGTSLLPLPFKGCMYSGLPEDAVNPYVPVFSKGDPFSLFDFIEDVRQEREDA